MEDIKSRGKKEQNIKDSEQSKREHKSDKTN